MCQEVWLLHCSANGLFMGRERVTRSGRMWIQNYYMNAFICAKAASLWALWHVRVCKYLLNLNLSPQLLVLWTRLEWEGGVGTLARKPVILYEIKKDRCLLRFFFSRKKRTFLSVVQLANLAHPSTQSALIRLQFLHSWRHARCSGCHLALKTKCQTKVGLRHRKQRCL